MIPSRTWFPGTLQERGAWFQNFADQIAVIGSTLGLTVSDVTSVTEDNTMVQFLATSAVSLEAYKDAVRQFRITLTEGDIGDPTPVFPANFAPSPASPGCCSRARSRTRHSSW